MARRKLLILKNGINLRFTVLIFYSLHQILVSTSIEWAGNTREALTTPMEWIKGSLQTHNFFRSLHGSPPLVLNKTLSEISQYYANYLLRVNLNILGSQAKEKIIYFEHNPEANRAGIGENLYYSIMTTVVDPIPPSHAVRLWYEEIKDYDFNKADRKPTSDSHAQIGHLTQILWKSTTQMGTAYASRQLPNNQTAVFVVANYFRQGNVVLRGNAKKFYFENVLPPRRTEADINSAIVSIIVRNWWTEPEPRSNAPESWRNSSVKVHNYYRKRHGAQTLRLNADLCKVSQLWADRLLEKYLRYFSRVTPRVEINFLASLGSLGENSMYFVSKEENISVDHIIGSWYKESSHYDFSFKKSYTRNERASAENFERIVWNSTTEFCMSYASKKANNGQYLIYVVANYYPSITYLEADRKRNVFPVKDEGASVVVIVLVTILLVILGLFGSLCLLRKFKYSWYVKIFDSVSSSI